MKILVSTEYQQSINRVSSAHKCLQVPTNLHFGLHQQNFRRQDARIDWMNLCQSTTEAPTSCQQLLCAPPISGSMLTSLAFSLRMRCYSTSFLHSLAVRLQLAFAICTLAGRVPEVFEEHVSLWHLGRRTDSSGCCWSLWVHCACQLLSVFLTQYITMTWVFLQHVQSFEL